MKRFVGVTDSDYLGFQACRSDSQDTFAKDISTDWFILVGHGCGEEKLRHWKPQDSRLIWSNAINTPSSLSTSKQNRRER
jgi:hypothetical protein